MGRMTGSVDLPRDTSPCVSLFWGQTTPAESRVYARLRCNASERCEASASEPLSGTIDGPYCTRSRTLPATAHFRVLPDSPVAGRPDHLLAEARLIDPCFWTPDLPHLYHVRLQFGSPNRPATVHERWLGIRSLGARQADLIMNGKRWVLRGSFCGNDPRGEFEQLSAERLCGVVQKPDVRALEQASRDGVMLVVQLADDDLVESALRRVARHAAVSCAVISRRNVARQGWPIAGRIGYENLLLAQRFAATDSVVPEPWADLAWVEDTEPGRLAERVARCTIPVVACRITPGGDDSVSPRRRCECWQRDLAACGDFAGYVV